MLQCIGPISKIVGRSTTYYDAVNLVFLNTVDSVDYLRRLIMTTLVLRILHVVWSLFQFLSKNKHTTTHNRFTALFPGPLG